MSDAKSAGAGRPLSEYLSPYKPRLWVGAALLLATNIVDKAIPFLLERAVDALQAGSIDLVRDFALGVLGLAVVMWAVRSTSRVWIFNVGRDVEFDVRNDLMRHLHRLGPDFYRGMPTGEIMSRATNDLGQVRLLVGFGAMSVVNSLFAYVGSIALMSTISWKLTLMALLPYPLFLVVARGFGRLMYTRSRDAQQALGRLAERAQENLAGIRVVRSFAIEEAELARFDEANVDAIHFNMRLVILRGLMFPILMGIGSVGTLIVVWKGGEMILDGTITVGQFAAFNAYLAQLVWPTLAFGYLLSVVQRGRASYDRVRQIMDEPPEVAPPESPRPAGACGALEVRELGFERDGHTILDDVSFDLPAGGTLAIVGPVGGGKSTLAALLPRLLPASRGSILLDGDEVGSLELSSLRRAVAYAQQEPFLFSTSIERNIALGLDAPDAPDTLARVRAAARDAAILNEVDSLPDGFETLVGERGVQLSGGQKQRIALARALLNEPAVLVLDDPLSAVDAETEETILETLRRKGEERTLIIITHRIAAASIADMIIVLDQGRVVERGKHHELVALEGVYAEIAKKQRIEQELSSL